MQTTFHTTPRILDASKGIVEYIASDTSLDADREIVIPSGVQFNRFQKNAPFLNNHRKGGPTVASIADTLGKVLAARVEGTQLIETVQWAVDIPEHKMAHLGFKMTERGYLKAVSLSFIPLKVIDNRNPVQFAEIVRRFNLDPMAEQVFTQVEQVELSAVNIGNNPNAVLKAFKDSALTEHDLHTIGIDSDERFDFLNEVAKLESHPEFATVAKSFVGAAFTSFQANPTRATNPARSQPSPPASRQTPGDTTADKALKAQIQGFEEELAQLLRQ